MNEQENTKLAGQMYETFMAGDVEGFLNLFSDDAAWHSPEIENVPLNGKSAGAKISLGLSPVLMNTKNF